MNLEGRRFRSNGKVKEAVRRLLYSQSTTSYSARFDKLVRRWYKRMNHKGDSVEKLQDMYLEDLRAKKTREERAVMEQLSRGGHSQSRRREYGFNNNRLQIHSLSGSLDKALLEGGRGDFRNPGPVQHHAGDGHTFTCSKCAEIFREFCEKTTLHGLKYVGDKEQHLLERLFWALSFILATLTAAYFIVIIYNKWDETPVIVSIGARATQMSDIPFPAVTICTMNEVRKSAAMKILETNDDTNKVYKKMLEEVCNNTDKEMPIRSWTNSTKDSWETVLNFMLAVRQPCHEMIVGCYYGGILQNCSDIFNPSLTDEGICCSFNKVKREYIFRNPRNLSDLNVTFPMPTTDWNPETGYPPGTASGTLPWRPRGAGSNLGLTVVLNAEVNEFHCSTSASVGFKLLLHNPVETPKIADYGSLIATGREYRIKIRPTINNATNSLRYVKEEDRQCAYSSDRYLMFYRTYTKRNCVLECEANYTLSNCNCVPYYLPKDSGTPICGKEQEGCTKSARRLLEMRMVDASSLDIPGNWTKPVCSCLPGCNELSYSTSMTYGNMDSSFTLSKGYLEGKLPYNGSDLKRNLAVVHLFFTETQFLNYYKTELFGLSDFLSSTGGLLGLFIGFSFLSAVEVIYFATVRLGCGIMRGRRNKTRAPAHVRNNPQALKYPFVK